jgi:hypothetical protein
LPRARRKRNEELWLEFQFGNERVLKMEMEMVADSTSIECY